MVDENLLEGRINADMLEKFRLDREAKGHHIEVCVRFGNSKEEKAHRMQILPAEEFKESNCNIIFGRDTVKRSRSSTAGLLGHVNQQLALHTSNLPRQGKYHDHSEQLSRRKLTSLG